MAQGVQGADGVEQDVVAARLDGGDLICYLRDVADGAFDVRVHDEHRQREDQQVSRVDEHHAQRGEWQDEQGDGQALAHHGDRGDHGVDVLGQTRNHVARAQPHHAGNRRTQHRIQRRGAQVHG